MINSKPTPDEIKSLAKSLKEETYGKVHDKFKEDQEYYELDFKRLLGLPEEHKDAGTVLPSARDMVDTAVDHTDISNARISVNKKGATNISLEDAEMMRKFYLGMIHRTNTESPISPWRVGAKHYWLHGVTFYKTVWDADRWPNKPTQKDGESEEDYSKRIEEWQGKTELSVPIIIQAINPYNVMPDPDHIESEYFMEYHSRSVFNMKRKYPKWSNPEGKDIKTGVEWIEYWDDTYKCFLADGESVLPVRGGVVKHNYGFIPYVEINSGLGNVAYDGELEMRYVGLLRYIFQTLVAESRNYSISDIILKLGAFPWWTVQGENAKLLTELNQKYGKINEIPEGVSLERRAPDTPSDAVYRQQAITSDILSSHGAPRSLRGLSETGVRSGADRRLLIAEASMKYAYSADAFENGTSKVLTNCARLFKNVVPGKMRLWARTPTDEFDAIIDKERMKEPFTCYVEFAPISEEDEYRRNDNLRLNIQTGLVTRRWARGQMPNVDVEAMEIEEEREKIKNSPAVLGAQQQYIQFKAQEAFGARMQAEQGVVPGTPAGPAESIGRMTTGIPNIAPLGSAQDLQNKMKQQRSQTPVYPGQGQGGGGARHA